MPTAPRHPRSTRPAAPAIAGAAGAIALVLAGCAGAPPTFTVVDAGITARSPEGAVVTFVVEGQNATADPAPIRTVTYALVIDGEAAFRAERLGEVTIPAGGTQRFRLPVVVAPGPDGAAPTGRRDYALSATVQYEAPGSIAEALFDSGIRRPTTTFRESGTLDFGS